VTSGTVLARFADALDYPGAHMKDRLAACVTSVAPESAEAAGLVAKFQAFADRTAPGRLEELYAAAFDLQEGCAPYLGAHLFRSDSRRAAFMAHLAESYRAHGFSAGTELPDHVGVVLRFLATDGGDEEATELLALAVVPAIATITEELARQEHPWEPVFRALLIVTRERAATGNLTSTPMPRSPVPGDMATEGERR
jgi:nitrate reductase molybdenum cofactor assembly chaperone NarJ/NarW